MLRRGTTAIALIIRVKLLRGQAWVSNLSQWSVPLWTSQRRRCRALGRLLRLRSSPLWGDRSMNRSRLVSLRMNVLWNWDAALVRYTSRRLSILEKLETSFDVDVSRIKICSTLIRV
jgi:hypothetical protein